MFHVKKEPWFPSVATLILPLSSFLRAVIAKSIQPTYKNISSHIYSFTSLTCTSTKTCVSRKQMYFITQYMTISTFPHVDVFFKDWNFASYLFVTTAGLHRLPTSPTWGTNHEVEKTELQPYILFRLYTSILTKHIPFIIVVSSCFFSSWHSDLGIISGKRGSTGTENERNKIQHLYFI